MKKAFLFLLLIGGVASVGFAQGVQLGLKAGINLASYAGDNRRSIEEEYGMDMKKLLGFHGGLSLAIPLSSTGFFSLQPELLYYQRGYVLDEPDYDFKQTVRDHYIDLPLLARIDANGLIFEAGPQLGYMVGARTKTKRLVPGLGVTNEEDNSLEGPQFNIGYIAGVGYQFASGPNLGARYNGSVTGIDGNSVFQFYVGYVFGSN